VSVDVGKTVPKVAPWLEMKDLTVPTVIDDGRLTELLNPSKQCDPYTILLDADREVAWRR